MTEAPCRGRRRAPAKIGAGLVLVTLFFTQRVDADPPTRPASPPPEWKWGRFDLRRVAGIELRYTRQPETERLCADEKAFRAAVAVSFDGFDAFESPQPDQAAIPMHLKRLEVSIARRKAEVTATMEWFDATGALLFRRELTQPVTECDRLFRSMVSSASTAIALAKTPLPALPPSPEPSPPARPRPPAPPVVDAGPHFRIGAAPLLAFAITPGIAAGGALDTAVRWRSVSLGLEGRLLLSPATDATGMDGVTISTMVAAVTAVPCFHVGWFFGCGLLELGALRFTGGDGVHVKTRDPFLAAGGLRVGVEWSFSERFALRGFADGASIFTRTTLVYNEMEVWTTPPIFGGIGAGLTASF